MQWQTDANIDTFVRTIYALNKTFQSNILAWGKYSSGNNGLFWSDAGDFSFMVWDQDGANYSTVEDMIEWVDENEEDDAKRTHLLKLLSKLKKDDYIEIDTLDNAKSVDDIGVVEYIDVCKKILTVDAMNGHVWDASVEDTIDAIVEMSKGDVVRKDLWEAIEYTNNYMSRDIEDIDAAEYADILSSYFGDRFKCDKTACSYGVVEIEGDNYMVCSSNDKDSIFNLLKDVYEQNIDEFEYDDIDDLFARSGNILLIREDFWKLIDQISKDVH